MSGRDTGDQLIDRFVDRHFNILYRAGDEFPDAGEFVIGAGGRHWLPANETEGSL